MMTIPTKTLRFDDDVLDVIRSMTWSDDGTQAVIGEKLDRPLYLRVDKALKAMGGKWNRKERAHLFNEDPRPQVEGLLENGSLTIEKDGFFETPPEVVDRMVQHVEPWGMILEPSAGNGAIIDRLCDKYGVKRNNIYFVERNTERANELLERYDGVCGDFLEYISGAGKFDRIYMNPPFENKQDIDHVRHAYKFLKYLGVLVAVMSEGTFFREDKKSVEFRSWLRGLRAFNEKLPANSFKTSGTGINARLVVIIKLEKGK